MRHSTLMRNFVIPSILTSSYEGEPGNQPPAPVVNPAPTGGALNLAELEKNPDFQKFFQTRLNAVNAEEKRKNRDLADQLKVLQQNAQLTVEEKEQLATQIKSLEETYQTKEEQAKIELDKVKKENETKLKSTEADREKFRNLYERKLVSVDIAKAASKYEAWNAEQIEAILIPLTKVEEDIDTETGKPNGQYVPKVNFIGRDKEGKDIKLKVSIDEAVKLMSEMTDKYGNLFKNKSVDGLNGNSNGGSVNGGRMGDIDNMSHAEYMKNRDRITAQMKKKSAAVLE